MQIIDDHTNCPDEALGSVIALGNFDGLHLGHHEVIKTAVEKGRKNKQASSVMTFEPHPRSFFKPDQEPFRLTTIEDKIRILDRWGVDFLFRIRFDDSFSKLTADVFFDSLLSDNLKVSEIVTGEDFVFGYNREGNSEFLKQKASKTDIIYNIVKPVGNDDEKYSSTAIRNFLRNGEVIKANELLGHSFQITGKVISGEKKGRQLGFPTANLILGDYIRPKFGVYKVRVDIDDSRKNLKAIANIGIKPTLGNHSELLEVHIFDFDQDIYDKNIVVRFDMFIREEKKFNSLDDLKKQIAKDCETVKECS